jgi:MORN repeat variant
MVRLALLILGCLLAARVSAAPLDDLRSPSQQVRDAAAALLRTSFVPPPRSRWDTVVAAINPGDSSDTILQMLQPYGVSREMGTSSGHSFAESYRLDDLWVLRCSFRRLESGDALLGHELIEHMRHVWIEPPAGFTGAWTTYFVNGQRSHEIHYRNGQSFGTVTSFYSNGSKAVVQHHGAEGADGEDIGYFPSGAIAYRGQYRKGMQVGTWVWYNEDGSVRSTQEH